jgi:hypothetical protein
LMRITQVGRLPEGAPIYKALRTIGAGHASAGVWALNAARRYRGEWLDSRPPEVVNTKRSGL